MTAKSILFDIRLINIKELNAFCGISMETLTHFSIFFTGNALLAFSDVGDLMAYAFKALIGGAIWMGYKIMADLISEKRKKKQEKDHEMKQ